MPRHSRRTGTRKVGRSRRSRMGGAGLWDWLKRANNFIKSNKLVSRIGSSLGSMGVPYASTIGSVAGTLGYGRYKKIHGGALRLTGGSLRPGGGSRGRMVVY